MFAWKQVEPRQKRIVLISNKRVGTIRKKRRGEKRTKESGTTKGWKKIRDTKRERGKRTKGWQRGRQKRWVWEKKKWSATTTAFHEMSFPSRRSSIKRRAASTVTDIDRVGRRCRRPRWVTSRDRCPSSIQKFFLSLPPRERDSNDFSFLSVMPPRSSSTFLPVPVIAHLLLPSPLRWGHLHATARVTCHVTRIEFDVVKCGPRWLLAKWEPCKGCILRRIVASFPFEPRRW